MNHSVDILDEAIKRAFLPAMWLVNCVLIRSLLRNTHLGDVVDDCRSKPSPMVPEKTTQVRGLDFRPDSTTDGETIA